MIKSFVGFCVGIVTVACAAALFAAEARRSPEWEKALEEAKQIGPPSEVVLKFVAEYVKSKR